MGKNKEIEDKLNILDRNLKMRNLIIHGIEDGEKAFFLLEAKIIKLIKEKIQYDININQIDYIKRVGQANEEKVRPVLICFLALRVKNIILKNKSKLKGTSDGILSIVNYPDMAIKFVSEIITQCIFHRINVEKQNTNRAPLYV